MINMPLLNILPLILSASRVKFIAQKFQIRPLLFISLNANPHLAIGVA